MSSLLVWTIQILLIPAFAPLVIGVIRKAKARMQNRSGASVLQPYRDLKKLFAKDEVMSSDASWVFRVAPYVIFGAMLAVSVAIPSFSFAAANPLGDLLTVVYVLALATFFLALAGIDTGGAFGGFGSSREMTVSALAEGGLVFSLLTLSLAAHTSNLFGAASALVKLDPATLAPAVLAFAAFALVLLAETGRFPFDNPATHLELTMIHEAMILEYSGKRLALIEWAAAIKLMVFLVLGANLFFPWGIAAAGAGTLSVAIALALTLGKVLILGLGIALLESSIAKYRYFRLPDLLFTSFVLSAISIGLILR